MHASKELTFSIVNSLAVWLNDDGKHFMCHSSTVRELLNLEDFPSNSKIVLEISDEPISDAFVCLQLLHGDWYWGRDPDPYRELYLAFETWLSDLFGDRAACGCIGPFQVYVKAIPRK